MTEQPFDADIFVEEFAAFSNNGFPYERYDGDSGVWYTADFSGTGVATGTPVVVDFTEPTTAASASDSGCEESDYDGLDVTGKIVLLQRGTCDFGLKAEIAGDEGATGAVIFNEGTIGADDRNDVLIPTLAGYDRHDPGGRHGLATGRALVDAVGAGTPTDLDLEVQGIVRQGVDTKNVIAETDGGRADRTVVVGAHLDSVLDGPGHQRRRIGHGCRCSRPRSRWRSKKAPRNKVRFIWFSGEEQGLLGSNYYVSQLTKKQVQSVSAMLDYDMLASVNFARLIYDGNGDEQGFAGPNGSGVIEQVFKDWWDSVGYAYETIPFDGRSDYDAFTTAGIPAGGIFAGAEDIKTEEQVAAVRRHRRHGAGPCYHQACDTWTTSARRRSSSSGRRGARDRHVRNTTSAVNGTSKSSSNATKDSDWKGDKLLR